MAPAIVDQGAGIRHRIYRHVATSERTSNALGRAGGSGAISAVVDAFADRLFADPAVGKFFVGMGADTRAGFTQKNKNLVCNVTGGPCQIISRPAKTVHAGLGMANGPA